LNGLFRKEGDHVKATKEREGQHDPLLRRSA
jgi:hypothetical protein